ncbi:MAG: SRPBCC family protein [Acidimicrobiales bacterium]|jgi:mxaD protein
MTAGAVDVTVGATPDEVWAKVGDFGGVADFFPGVESCRLEGDDRVIGLFGMEIRERLLARDDQSRTLTYSVVAGVPLESHTATVSVLPEGEGSRVIWAYDVSPDEMAPVFGDSYQAALNSLENTFS